MMMKKVSLLVLVMLSFLQLICISSFTSAKTAGAAYRINNINNYTRCEGLEDEGEMVAAGNGSLYKNGTGCGQMVMVTCVGVDPSYNCVKSSCVSSCVSSKPVVVKLTHYCVICPYTLLLPEVPLSYIADQNSGGTIDIIYEIYNKDNYTQLNNLKQGEIRSLSDQPLLSANNLFSLQTYTWSSYSYMAIFLRNGYRHPVWIGYRNATFDAYGYNSEETYLALSTTGKFSLQSVPGGDLNVFYDAQIEGNISMIVTLLDSGNLVLREMNLDGTIGRTLWQSFDYPTDTLLPGMKLGINHKTGRNWKLTSWLNDSIVYNGSLSLEWDPKGRALVLRHQGVSYWTSGILKDRQRFEFLQPNDSSLYFTNVSNKDEEYFTFTLGDGISGWTLEDSGRISFGDKPPILQEDLCSGYDNLGGCQLREHPKCRSHPQNFENRSGIFLGPGNMKVESVLDDIAHGDATECKERCWGFCDCFGYLYQWNPPSIFLDYNQSSCYLWRGKNLSFVEEITSPALYALSRELPPPPPPPIQSDHGGPEVQKHSSPGKKLIWILIPLIIFMLSLLIGILSYLQRRKRQQRKHTELDELMTLDGYTEEIALNNDGKKGQDIKVFSYSCIEAATSGFSAENKLGEGGFGPVYKGQLPNGQNVAVKKLSKKSTQGLLEFKTELILIARLQHDNLVRLFGYCIHGNEKMLIYEYMPNKSLDFFLFDETKKQQLPWERRFRIIEGIAQGLLYLHKFSRLKIVHRDLKAGNILLDENMNPHIADFGTARIFKPNISETNTVHISGTHGYMAPEYREKGTFSIKSDVFSFGVLVLEIVSGRRANSFYDAHRPMNLVTYAWELWNGGAAIDLIDRTLVGSCTVPDQMINCIHVGLLCVQHHANHRPTMSKVISMLSTEDSALAPPKPPAFFLGNSVIEDGQENIISASRLTLSEIVGR